MMRNKQNAIKNTIWLGAAAVATSALTLSTQAAPKMQPMPGMPNVMTAPPMKIKSTIAANFDKLFMLHAAAGNLFEVESGKLALQKSSNVGVRTVAQTIIMGHSKAQMQLAALMKAKGMMLPMTTGPAEMASLEMLKRTPSGAAFDKAFMAGQVEAHENTVTLFAHEIDSGKDAATKKLANAQLPGILQHTALIYKVGKEVGAPGGNMRPASLMMLGDYKKGGMMKSNMMKH